MDRSESINELAAALAKAQADIEPAPMDSVNPHYRRRFASLASVWGTVIGPLTANGLAVVQCPEATELGLVLRTTLMHHSGQWIGSAMPLMGHGETMQTLGSSITYARRYALAAILGIVAEEDDDAEAATAPTRAEAPPPRREAAPAQAPAKFPRMVEPPPRKTSSHSTSPKTGRELWAWAGDTGPLHDTDLRAFLAQVGERSGFPHLVVKWNAAQVAHGLAAAVAHLRRLEGKGDAYEPEDAAMAAPARSS